MDIESQKAETIYNVAGDMYLEYSEENVAILNKNNQKKLKELNSISYFEILSKEYSKKKLIDRETEISKIKKRLDENQQLILYGEPGIGKTTILFQLSSKLENLVYISIKDKSPISIVTHLVNKIRLFNCDDLLEFKDLDDALEWLQICLQKSKQCFIIDDCEQDKTTASKIIALHKFGTSFLFASRNKSLFESTGAAIYPCTPFSENEVNQFLISNGLSSNKLKFNRILKASNGNPLYLFYFTQFPNSPLPENLKEYQNSFWSGLTPNQQEILALISISYFNITTTELAEVLNFKHNLEFSREIDNLSDLIKNFEGFLELFHPSFKEFILEKLSRKGLLNSYQEKLGDYYLTKEEIIQATYLLIDIAPSKVEKYLFDIFPILISSGELGFALKVLNTKLLSTYNDIEKGYLYYHLCHVHDLLGNKDESNISIDKSLEYSKSNKDRRFYESALIFKAINLVERGSISEATKIADEVFLNLKEDDKEYKANLLINLSKIYIDLSEFEKGATLCKEAFDIFEEKGLIKGMVNSLVNLTSCLTRIDEYEDEVEKYGLALLELVKNSNDLNDIEVIVLNSLSSYYREKGQYSIAKDFCFKAIKLCQQYEMKYKVVINLINYANIFRDEGLIVEAINIYNEALVKTKENKLKKEESRIYWIFAGIYTNEGKLEISMEYADKSINLSKEVNYVFGTAVGLSKKSEIYLLMNEPLKAAQTFAECSDYYGKIDHNFKDCLTNILKAISIYNNLGNKIEVNNLIDNLLENKGKLLKNTFINKNTNTITQCLNFLSFCNTLEEIEGQKIYIRVVNWLIENIGKTKYSYSILGIVFEQSGYLINHDDLNSIMDLLQNELPLLSIREIDGNIILIVSIANQINLEIQVLAHETTCIKLAIAIILILHEQPELIKEDKQFNKTFCLLCIYLYTDEIENNIGNIFVINEESLQDNPQSWYLVKEEGYEEPDIIIVNPTYELNNNLINFSEKKSSLSFFISVISGIKNNFYHSSNKEYDSEKTFIISSVAKLLGYSLPNHDEESDKLKFKVNIDNLYLNRKTI